MSTLKERLTSTDVTPAPAVVPPQAATPTRQRDELDQRIRMLMTRLAELSPDNPDRARLRGRVAELLLPLAEQLARRFQHRGEPLDDLVQVACVGLLKSIDGYDPTRENEFYSYAVPTIVGELKRHFRDKGWSLHVPRRLQELSREIGKSVDVLYQRLGRSPTVADLANYLGIDEETVLEGMQCADAYSALSLYTPISAGDSKAEVADMLGDEDPELAGVDERESLRPLIAKLSRREQRILAMRFFGNMTQSQIAAEMGISQVHVSRLIAQSLVQLRQWLVDAG